MNTLDSLIRKRVLNIVTEKTILSSPDGSAQTLSSDQKKKAQMASDSGDDVEIKKQGDPVKENDEVKSDIEGDEKQPADASSSSASVQALHKAGTRYLQHIVRKKESMLKEKKDRNASRMCKYLESAEKYMTRSLDEMAKSLEHENKINEAKKAEEEKETSKFSDLVRTQLAKQLNNKDLVNTAMTNYSKVMHMVRDKNPKEVATAILKHAMNPKKKF